MDGWMDGSMDRWMDERRTWLTQSFDRRTDPTVGQKVEGDNSYAETPKDRRESIIDLICLSLDSSSLSSVLRRARASIRRQRRDRTEQGS